MTIINGTEWLTHRGSVGKVQPGARLVILDDEGSECRPGEIGEIYFVPESGGHGISYHYIGAEPKIRGAGTTLGDLGYVDPEGYLYIADRRTDLILSGGANIYPAEVEAAIESHAGVHSCAAIGLPDDDMGQLVHAVVHANPGWETRLDEAALRAHVEERIARYKAPRSYEFTATPLRGDDGKMRRAAIREEVLRRRGT
jgi:bile acid-coenzyme A ligase